MRMQLYLDTIKAARHTGGAPVPMCSQGQREGERKVKAKKETDAKITS